MATFPYDPAYNPPAPTVKIEISTDLLKAIGVGDDARIGVTMVLDTGADTSLVPYYAVKLLEREISRLLPYDFRTVEGYDGERSQHKAYTLTVQSGIDGSDSGRDVVFLAIKGNEGVLGRDVLNEYSISLDGPKGRWGLFVDTPSTPPPDAMPDEGN